MRRVVLLLVVAGALWGAPGAFAAGWCGPGETSTDLHDAVTGRQVHAVYVVPADGPDGFATVAPRLADDVASITTWWQGQDPTRVPRFDQAAFPAGTCLDISFVRLPDPASAFSSANTAYQRLAADLFAAGLNNPFKKYLVYYDGPSVQLDICGTGGGEFDVGPAYAVVWLAGCPGIPDDGVAAHELLHALGALPAGAPHACTAADNPVGPFADPGHPCDSTQDILYPYTSGQPLAQEVLDVGHDDYYGHSGTWIDIQDSLWLHLLAAVEIPVAVSIGGAGSVSSDVPGVFCSTACTTEWDSGSKFSLDAIPSSSSRFVGWTGACTGRELCAVDAAAATSVTARFGPLRIPVAVGTAGKGTVRCTPRCARTIAGGAALTLRAVAAKGWRFSRWSGDCAAVRGPVCRPKTDYHVTARATFRRR